MVRFSETALELLHSTVESSGLAEGRCLRLIQDGDEFALTIDYPDGWDTLIQHRGKMLLVLSQEVKDALGEAATVEAKEDDRALQLIVRKPAA